MLERITKMILLFVLGLLIYYLCISIGEEKIIYFENCITKEGNISYLNIEDASIYETYINELPAKVQKILINEEWSIKETQFEDITLFGGTCYSERVILINENRDFLKNTLIHEIGHIIDNSYLFGMYSETDLFLYLMDLYKNTYINFVYMDNGWVDGINNHYILQAPEEFFAGAFTDFIFYPDTMKERYPLLYEYFNYYIIGNPGIENSELYSLIMNDLGLLL